MRHSAWIIDKDHLKDPNDPGERDEAGTMGPSDAPDELCRRLQLKSKPGQTFRLYDDDGELYYTGRILFEPIDGEPVTIETADEEDAFGPLWDFGAPNAGANDLRYFGTRNGERRWLSL